MRQTIKNKLIHQVMGAQFKVGHEVKRILTNTQGEGYVDTGVKIIISVVIGGLLLTGLYALFQLTILPSLETKIQELFSYGG